MPCNYKNYPKNWKTEIRPDILKRANNACEFCGVKNYSAGRRVRGVFVPVQGNLHFNKAGRGELPYKEANDLIINCNSIFEEHFILIVLTIAHLDHNTQNNDYTNLKALCQKCHNNHDKEYRATNRKNNIQAKKRKELFLF